MRSSRAVSPMSPARLASEMGVLAFKRGFERWSGGQVAEDDGLAEHALAALAELRAAAASLG